MRTNSNRSGMSLDEQYHYADGTAAELEQEYIDNNWNN